MRRFLARLLLALLIAAAGAPALAQPPVWVLRDKDSTLILFGSVHLLPSGLDWRPPQVVEALAKADDVWFELPISTQTEIDSARLAQARGMLPAKDNLWNHLSPVQAERLRKVSDRLHLYTPALERMRPWLAEVTLSVIADGQAGATTSDGVEQQLSAITAPTARRRAFETPAQQIEFLAGATMADQVASLDQTLEEMEREPDLYRRIVQNWMDGDVKAIETQVLEPTRRASPVVYDRLITRRNARWAQVLTRRMKGAGLTVVVVGVGHLVGPGGLPALMRARGFKVEGP